MFVVFVVPPVLLLRLPPLPARQGVQAAGAGNRILRRRRLSTHAASEY